MQKLNGGYVMIDLNDTNNIYARAKAAIGCGKPIMIFDDPECYYADSIALDGDDNVIIVKGGKTITINDANAVISEGSASAPTMENIVDLDGNKRFIDGDINLYGTHTGVTRLYGKWSLSGTHLMVVLALDIASGSTLTANEDFARITLPKYIYEKITHLYANDFADIKEINCIDNVSIDTQLTFATRVTTNYLYIRYLGTTTTTTKAYKTRIQFDLLIDQE